MIGFSSFESGWPVFLSTLSRIVVETAPGRPVRRGLENALAALRSAPGYRRVALELFDLPKKNSRLTLTQSRDRTLEHLYAPGPLATGQVLATRRPLIIEDVKNHPDFIGRPPEELETQSFLCVPVMLPDPSASEIADGFAPGRGGVLGSLSVDLPKAPRVFLEAHCEFLGVAAAIFASVTDRLREELSRPRRKSQPTEPGPEPEEAGPAGAPVSVSKSMRLVLRQIAQAAPSSTPVLFRGEEGAGKEYLAGYLYRQGPRRSRPFFKIGCGAESPERVEAALFGVRKSGAPGASRPRRGLFELSQGGVVFLDDIDELSPEAQARVLRVIQEGTALRLGGDQPIPVDARVLAASKVSLEDLVARGDFLEDLYYALSVISLYVPALRDRSGDVLPLAEYFLDQFSRTHGKEVKRISTPAIDLLNQYHWPGNARELSSCMERAAMLCDEGVVRTYHLPPTLQTGESSNTEPSLTFGDAVAGFERELLVDALKKARGNMFQAARNLRESYRVVNYKVKKYGIDPKRYTPGRR